jgi:ABC-type nitrate/sulfonate/bicarbonate transport system substrate-binding protein
VFRSATVRRHRARSGFFVFLILQFLSGAAGAVDKIRLAVPDVGGQFITFPLAQARGFLKQESIDAEIILIRGNAALAAVSGGDVDYTVGIPQGVRGALLGMPLKIVACFEPTSTLMLLTVPKVKSVDVEGKKLGYSVLARTHEVISFPQSGLTIHSKLLRERPDQIKRMIRAGIKANQYIRTNRDGSIKFFAEWQRASAEIAAATYDSVWRVYSADGNIPMDGLNLVVQDTKELIEAKRDVPLNDFVDLTALRQAQTELGVKGK